MNEFWDVLTDRDLQELEPRDLPYAGTRGMVRRFRRRIRPKRRSVYRALAAAAALALLSLGVWAGYTSWRMPDEAEPYTGDPIQVHEENTYTVDPDTGLYEPEEETGTNGPEAWSDQWFLTQAVEVLELVGKEDVDRSRLTVTRQTNQSWNREEVVVNFSGGDDPRSVKFDWQSGYLIGATAFDTAREDGVPMDDEAALAAAQGYYDALPYAEGYEYRYVEKFDDQSWMYCFDRPVSVELWGEAQILYSAYEEVRIIIDPCTGAFQDSNCFYVPLLDDHQPGDEPLPEAQARAIAEGLGVLAQDVEQYAVTASLSVCLPEPEQVAWLKRAPEDGAASGGERTETAEIEEPSGYRYYEVTRLGWRLRYDGELDGFADSYEICIDLYTGQVLSIDMTR